MRQFLVAILEAEIILVVRHKSEALTSIARLQRVKIRLYNDSVSY